PQIMSEGSFSEGQPSFLSLSRKILNEEYFTVFQTLNWLYLIDTFASIKKKSLKNNNDDVLVGNYKWVKELWANQHGSHL
ncbi:6239_t:CDS:1, partial [Gigaspora rosea]